MASTTIGVGTQIVFGDHAGDYAPAAGTKLDLTSQTTVQNQFASVSAGAAVNSTQVDLGAARNVVYHIDAAMELAASVAAGGTIDFYWSGSPISTAANANPGKPDGSDGAYTGDGAGTVAESVAQMQKIGTMVVTDLPTATGVQVAYAGAFSPTHRYGQLVTVNNTSVAFHSDDVESHVVFTPVTIDSA